MTNSDSHIDMRRKNTRGIDLVSAISDSLKDRSYMLELSEEMAANPNPLTNALGTTAMVPSLVIPDPDLIVMERHVDRRAIMTGEVGHRQDIDKTRDAKLMGFVIHRRETIIPSDPTHPPQIRYSSAQYADNDRLGRWADKLNPLTMFCNRVAVRKEKVDVVPRTRSYLSPPSELKDRGIEMRCINVVNYDKVAYWAEKLLRIQCQGCQGRGKTLANVKCPQCRGCKTTPMKTAWTAGKIQYAMSIIAKRKAEVSLDMERVEWNMGNHVEVLNVPTPKEKLIFTFDLEEGRMTVETQAAKDDDWGNIPTVPTIRHGDIIVSEWDLAKELMERMRKVERRAERGTVKLRPFHGMDDLFDVLYEHNEDDPEGVYLRGDPHQFTRPGQRTVSDEHAWRSHMEAAIWENYQANLKAINAALDFANMQDTTDNATPIEALLVPVGSQS